jgi:hypothetical protein
MNAITKYERRHSINNDDISLGRTGCDDSSIDTNSIYSSSSRIDDDSTVCASSLLPQHLRHRWKIVESEVSELPEIYPRLSSPLIVQDSEISKIGDHLWSFLRANDIRSAYDRQEGRVLCSTNRLSFVVQFWRRKIQQENTDCEEIILEIQRRRGCSWTMQKIRSAMKKWILRKQNQQQQRHHQKSRRLQFTRSKSERFGMIGLEPLVLDLKISSNHSKNDSTTSTDVDCKSNKSAPATKSLDSPTISVANQPLFSCSMPPLRPTFGVCPQPHWQPTEAPY